MNVAVLLDVTDASARAHAAIQATRLRNRGFAVAATGRRTRKALKDPVDVVYAVGAGGWWAARRTAKRHGVPLVYDHPPGCPDRPSLGSADAVIASGYADAARLTPLLASTDSAVVVKPPLLNATAVRARLRERLNTGRAVLALQEAATVTSVQAEKLVLAVEPLSDLDLVFLGGEHWADRAGVARIAERTQSTDRIHFIPDVPSSRRIAYLNDADVGLALSGGDDRDGVLAAADVFHALGVPFVVEATALASTPPDGIATNCESEGLRAALCTALDRQRIEVRDDGGQVLESLLTGLVAGANDQHRIDRVRFALLPRFANKARSFTAEGIGSVTGLLASAQALRERGERDAAIDVYQEVARGAHPAAAIAAAAVGLARLNARAEAQTALEVVLAIDDRPPLATARAGVAAAALGDLPAGRALADAALVGQQTPLDVQRTALRVLEQVGELTAALEVARGCRDEPSVARIEGTLTSYDPSWRPARLGTGTTQTPRAGRVFMLLETSLPHARSGYTYRARTLLRAQRDLGLDPVALTRLGFPANRGLTAPATEEVDGIVHYRTSLPGVKRYTSVPMPNQIEANVRWATSLGRALAPEMVIATTPHLNGLVGVGLRGELGVPIVYDVRGFPEMTWAVRKGGATSEIFQLRREMETRCMREADVVTTLSETMRRHIVSRGVDADKILVLPHAVDTKAFTPSVRDRALARQLDLDQRVVIAYISSLVPYEGVETLVDAVALARETDPRVAGLIVGDGELLDPLKDQVDQLGLTDHFVFTGRVDASEVGRYYSLADVFVCPRHDHEVTRYVTPLKPFEAMAAGCCLAVSDLPTLREAVLDGECGVLFPAGDATALAETILSLAEDSGRRNALAVAARNHACADHDLANLRTALAAVRAKLGLPPLPPRSTALDESVGFV